MENFTCVTFVYLLYCIKLESFRKLPLSSKRNFFKNLCDFLLCDFLLWPIIQQSFQKFVRADLEILACIIFGQIGPKIYTFLHRRVFFCKFHLRDFCLPIMSYYAAKFQKIRSSESWENGLRNFWTELPQNYSFAPKKDFFETFT